MGWNLGSRFTIGHSGLVGQCAASFLDMWSQKTNSRNSANAFRWGQRKCRCWVYSVTISWWTLLPGSKQTRRPADTELHFCDAPTTTLPSEGHQNVLVNAAFVLLSGGGAGGALGPGCVCTAPTTARAGVWCRRGGKGWCDISKGLLYTCMLHLWLTRCESLQRGGHCLKSYYRWNVAHGGWIAVERSRRRWMYVRNMDPVWLMCE